MPTVPQAPKLTPIEYIERETMAAEKYLPIIEQSKASLNQQVKKTEILKKQLSALIELFKQKEDNWNAEFEKLKKNHSRAIKRQERQMNEYKKLLDDKDLQMKGIFKEFDELEEEWNNMPQEEEVAKPKKKKKKKVKFHKTVKMSKGPNKSKKEIRLRNQEERLQKIQKTVDLIKEDINPFD